MPVFRRQGHGHFINIASTAEIRAQFVAIIPLGRMSTPRDVAAACLFLASEEAEFLTGVCLEVDGGDVYEIRRPDPE